MPRARLKLLRRLCGVRCRSNELPELYVDAQNATQRQYAPQRGTESRCSFNCAEAINFANESWVEVHSHRRTVLCPQCRVSLSCAEPQPTAVLTLQIGKQAIPCRCTKGAVRFDMRIFEDRASPLAVLCS